MNIETILVGGGIFFLFFAIIGYIIFPKLGMGPPLTKWTRLGLCISGIILLAIGIIGIKGPLMAPTTMPSQSPILPEIKIINPKEGEKVSVKSEVGVNFSGRLPEGQYMWVVVNPVTSHLQW